MYKKTAPPTGIYVLQ